MPGDLGRVSRTNEALVAHRPHSAASPVERRMTVDPRTHTKSVYQRGSDGSEMYASYYNSNDDPTFQDRFNQRRDGNVFMQSAQFTFVSHGGGAGRNHNTVKERQRPVVIEEPDDTDEHGTHTDRGHHDGVHATHTETKRRPSKQDPIVEEPDSDDDYNKADSRTHHRSGTKGERSSQPHAPGFPMHPLGMESFMQDMMSSPFGFGDGFPFTSWRAQRHGKQKSPPTSYESKWQLSPYTHGGMMGGPFTGDFFGTGGPENPFPMMEAMRYHMHKQRASMFGGVDPFAHFI